MSTEKNLAIVKHILEEFARTGDTQPLFDVIADDAVFVLAIPRDLPLARVHRGKDGLRAYFERARELMELLESRVHGYLADDCRVVVLGDERYRARSTGIVYATEWVLRFDFAGDKIVRMHSFEDLTGLVEAAP